MVYSCGGADPTHQLLHEFTNFSDTALSTFFERKNSEIGISKLTASSPQINYILSTVKYLYENETKKILAIVPEPGIYRGQCTELCGKDHGFMPIVVEVLPEAEFDAWYASQISTEVVRTESFDATFTHEELMAKGEELRGTRLKL